MKTLRHVLSKLIRICNLNPRWTFTMNDGSRFRLSRHIESHSLWIDREPNDVTKFVCRNLKPGDTFVDIGANVGRVSIPASKHCAWTVAFEPGEAFWELLTNANLNTPHSISLVSSAVSGEDGQVEFFDAHISSLSGMSGISDRKGPPRIIKAVGGYSLLQAYSPIAMLKIDTEGADYDILKGFGSRLNEIPIIVFECSRANLAQFGYTPREVVAYLRNMGRTVQILCGDSLAPVPEYFDPENVDLVSTVAKVGA